MGTGNCLKGTAPLATALQPALAAAPPISPLHAWRCEWRQRRVFVLEIISHTHGSTITTAVGVIGKHDGVTELNENGKYFLQLCCSNGLRIMNTLFPEQRGSQVYYGIDLVWIKNI